MKNLTIRIEVRADDAKKALAINSIVSNAELNWCRDQYASFQFAFDKMAKKLWEALKKEGVIS